MWKEIRKVSPEQAQKEWARYVAEREKMGQPVNPRNGAALKRGRRFDPVLASQAEAPYVPPDVTDG